MSPPDADDPGASPLADPVDPPVLDAMTRLAAELEGEPDGDTAAKLEWVVNVLILRGHLAESHRTILAKVRANRRLSVVFGSPDPHVPDPDVDCASLIPLCRARCCSFNVALTEEEVLAGEVEWNVHKPYFLPKNPDTGYCAHLGAAGGCTKYTARPGTCRKYDCRQDKRIWEDFEARIPAPMFFDVTPIEFDDE
jgi:hypothetical protein